jgi:hypothetical protein
MDMRVIASAIVAAAVAIGGIAPAAYAADVPAPPGESDAVAVRLHTILSLSHTHAKADQAQGSASGNVIEINGAAPAAQFGGSAKNNEKKSGALLDTGTTPLGRLAITPWKANSSTSDAARHGDSHASVLELTLVNPNTLDLAIITSDSVADHNTATLTSTGKATSDGAVISAGGASGLKIVVLHAEASSDGTGDTYILAINTTKIGTNSQVAPLCSGLSAVPAVLALTCLTVTGGVGKLASQDLGANVGNAISAAVSRTSVDSGKGVAVLPEQVTQPAPPPVPATLPRTGAMISLMVFAALMLVTMGYAAIRASRITLAPVEA